jgi:hypothetical protein
MSSAYAYILNCSLPVFVPLGTSFILRITFCNAKLNNIGDKESPCCICECEIISLKRWYWIYSLSSSPALLYYYHQLYCCFMTNQFWALASIFLPHTLSNGARGGAVVEAMSYRPEGCGIDAWRCYWNFSLTESFQLHYGPGVDSVSHRNEYQGYLLGVMAAGA